MKTITIVTKLGNICVSISKVQVQSSKFKYCLRTSAFEKKNTTKMYLKRNQFCKADYLKILQDVEVFYSVVIWHI